MKKKNDMIMSGFKDNSKWQKERATLKKIQIHFEFQQEVMRQIRYDAADARLNPSDIVRKILGFSYSKVQRPRLGLSFSQDELKQLADRYGLDCLDEKEIKQRVMAEVNAVYQE
ncbi:MAG: hypothetical protein OCC45_10780 [Desulfotalea sp.]